jgi:hypothetical protein
MGMGFTQVVRLWECAGHPPTDILWGTHPVQRYGAGHWETVLG